MYSQNMWGNPPHSGDAIYPIYIPPACRLGMVLHGILASLRWRSMWAIKCPKHLHWILQVLSLGSVNSTPMCLQPWEWTCGAGWGSSPGLTHARHGLHLSYLQLLHFFMIQKRMAWVHYNYLSKHFLAAFRVIVTLHSNIHQNFLLSKDWFQPTFKIF